MIVPRWEWRIFEPSADAELRLSALKPDREQRSDEHYLLSLNSDASVKVRDGNIDVKRLIAVEDRGLEQWMPVMNSSWPLVRDDVRDVVDTVGGAPRTLDRDAYDQQAFVDEVVTPDPSLLVVAVHKHRVHYTIGGCMAELSELQADGHVTRTIAVESTDPDRVVSAVGELGLVGQPVVCMARGLKALVGFGSHRYAVIDVGTNSVKFHLAERRADDTWRTLVDRAEITQLGEDLDGAAGLAAASIERTAAAVAAMREQARADQAEEIAVVGTAALRNAPNAAAFAEAVRARSGLTVEVITGDDEARLAFLAARAGLAASGRVVVFDTGGGSSQFSFSEGDRVIERFSLNVGAISVTERFGLSASVSPEALADVFSALSAELAPLSGRPVPDVVIGMGGALTNLAAVKHRLGAYDPDVIQGTVLELSEIDRQIELYRARRAERRREIVGLQPNRAEVILAGACIVRTVLALLHKDSLLVSDRGLRHGVLAERFGRRRAAG